MSSTFNYIERSGELLKSSMTDEEAAKILTEEADSADITILDDGAWFGLLKNIEDSVDDKTKE